MTYICDPEASLHGSSDKEVSELILFPFRSRCPRDGLDSVAGQGQTLTPHLPLLWVRKKLFSLAMGLWLTLSATLSLAPALTGLCPCSGSSLAQLGAFIFPFPISTLCP